GEHAIAPLITQAGQSTTEKRVVIHERPSPSDMVVFATLERFPGTFLEGFWLPCRPPIESMTRTAPPGCRGAIGHAQLSKKHRGFYPPRRTPRNGSAIGRSNLAARGVTTNSWQVLAKVHPKCVRGCDRGQKSGLWVATMNQWGRRGRSGGIHGVLS